MSGFQLPPTDDFLRDMSANVAHRRGSVIDDTCFRCGQRVYLLERHLTAIGQLFHRHCYRDSERTATLQRASSRCLQKENLLPPSRPEAAASTGRRGRRKSSPSTAKNIEPAAAALTTSAEGCAVKGKHENQTSAKSTEVQMPKIMGMSRGSGVAAHKKVPIASVAATQLAAPKSTESGTSGAIQRLLAQNAKHPITPKIGRLGTTCTQQDRNSKIAKTKITTAGVDERVDASSTTGSSSAVDQRAADGSKDTARSRRTVETQPPHHRRRTSVPSAVNRARPAAPTTKQAGASKSKTTSPDAVDQATYVSSPSASLSPPSISSIDHSCDVIPINEPARLVFRYVAPGFNVHKEQITATTSTNHVSRKPNGQSTSTTTKHSCLASSPCSVRNQSSTSTAFESSSDRDSLLDASFSSMSPCLSNDSAFATPASSVFSESGMSTSGLKTVTEPMRSGPQQVRSVDSESTRSVQRRTSVEKQVGPSTKTCHLYRPKSLENLIEPSHGWKTHQTSQLFHDNGVSPVNKEYTTAELVSQPSTAHSGVGVYFGRRRLGDRNLERSKSTCDLLSTTSDSRVCDEPHEARQDSSTRFRNEPIVHGLLENLAKATQRKQQESNLIGGNEMASKMPDVVASAKSGRAVTPRSAWLLQQADEQQRRSTSPVTNDSVTSHSHLTAGPQGSTDKTSEQNKEDVSPTFPRDQVRGTTPKVDSDSAELIGKKKYVTKWQAELQRRRNSHLGRQLNSPCSEQKPQRAHPASVDSFAPKVTSPVKRSPHFPAAANGALSSRFSKSVNDLSEISRPAAAVQMTDWQLEVERRRAARGGRYVDPEKLPRSRGHNTLSKTTAETPEKIRKSKFQQDNDFTSVSAYAPAALYKNKKKLNLSASVDNLATCHLADVDTSRSILQVGPTPPDGKRASFADKASSSSSETYPTSSPRSVIVKHVPTSPTLPDNYYESIDEFRKSPVAELDSTSQVGDFALSGVLRRYQEGGMPPKFWRRLWFAYQLSRDATVV